MASCPGRPAAGDDFRGRTARGGGKYRYLLVGWLWYLGMLVPVIGLVQVGPQGRADRYMYLPQIGLAIAIAWGAAEWTKHWRHLPLLYGGASAAMLVALAWCSWLQTRYWHDSLTLWTHTVELDFDDNNDFAHHNLGVALAANGDADKAAEQYQEAIRINPPYSEAHNDLGLYFYAKKDLDRALDELQQAVTYNPFYANARNNLGNVLYLKNRIPEAVAQFNEVLKLDPHHPLASITSAAF